MKITDQELLNKIFITTAERLPHMATYHYFGNQIGLGSTDEWSNKYATWICTAFRERALKTGLSSTQSMNRIIRLIAIGELVSEKRTAGQAFNFRLPDSITKPMFVRTFELLIENGIPKEPQDATGFNDIAKRISEELIIEFGEMKRAA